MIIAFNTKSRQTAIQRVDKHSRYIYNTTLLVLIILVLLPTLMMLILLYSDKDQYGRFVFVFVEIHKILRIVNGSF